jgi:hypothetical protein
LKRRFHLAGPPEVLKDEAKSFAALPTEIPMRLDALLNIDKGLPPWACIEKSNAANDPLPLVHEQMRSLTLFDGQRREPRMFCSRPVL